MSLYRQRGAKRDMCVIFMSILHYGAVGLLPVTDVLGESGGFLRVFSQQSLIARERLHQTHVAGQRHWLFDPHTLMPVIHMKKQAVLVYRVY